MPKTTIYIPDDIEVNVDYHFDDEDIVFDEAFINGRLLATDSLFYKEDEKFFSLNNYFQEQLEKNYEELFAEYNEGRID